MGEKYEYKYKTNIAICIIAARPLRLPLNSMFSPRGRCCARFISPPPLYKYKEQTNKETNTRSRCFRFLLVVGCFFCIVGTMVVRFFRPVFLRVQYWFWAGLCFSYSGF